MCKDCGCSIGHTHEAGTHSHADMTHEHVHTHADGTVHSHAHMHEAGVGEYVLIHVGFAMEKIDTQRAKESIEIYEQIAKQMRVEESSVYESIEPRAGAEN